MPSNAWSKRKKAWRRPPVCKSKKKEEEKKCPPFLTTDAGTFFFPTTYTCTPQLAPLTDLGNDEWGATIPGSNGSSWEFKFTLIENTTITGTVVATTPSGTTTGHATDANARPPGCSVFGEGNWARDTGGSLTGTWRIDWLPV